MEKRGESFVEKRRIARPAILSFYQTYEEHTDIQKSIKPFVISGIYARNVIKKGIVFKSYITNMILNHSYVQ